jgi:OOP family OmpA-OmpF porin
LGIELMAQLPDGEAEIAGRRLTVRGTAPTEETAAAALARLKALPAPFVGESAIVTAMEIPELQGVKLAASGATAGECQTAFSRIMARNTINFDVASAVVAADSRSVLDKLAFVSKRCSRFRIDVAGHTDSTGAREDNLRLSKARANAVAEYLTAQGVAADRVSAHGFGPDRPLAPNNDPAGMAKNRRIEFTVRADGAL